jgi:hypothetical protein
VGEVAYDGDDRRRLVVRRYGFDPARRERRHVVVAVVDNRREFKRLIGRLHRELEQRRASGEDVDPREHISGHVMEPGHLERSANAHLVRRAVEHGVFPAGLEDLELPSNIALFVADEAQ